MQNKRGPAEGLPGGESLRKFPRMVRMFLKGSLMIQTTHKEQCEGSLPKKCLRAIQRLKKTRGVQLLSFFQLRFCSNAALKKQCENARPKGPPKGTVFSSSPNDFPQLCKLSYDLAELTLFYKKQCDGLRHFLGTGLGTRLLLVRGWINCKVSPIMFRNSNYHTATKGW